MKNKLLCAAAMLMLAALTACGGTADSAGGSQAQTAGTASGTTGGTSDNTGGNAAGTADTSAAAEGTTADINAAEVVKIVTDDFWYEDTHLAKTDWASTHSYAVYDFTDSAEITTYIRVFYTDPNKYYDTDRILTDEEWEVTWNEDHTMFEQVNKFFGLSYTVEDVLGLMDSNEDPYTAFLKDGSTVHVSYGKAPVSGPADNTAGVDTSKYDVSGNGKVIVPKYFFVSAFIDDGGSRSYDLYRMGDEFMAVHYRDVTYCVKDGDFYKCKVGEINGAEVEWDSEWYENLELYRVFTNSDFGTFAERMDNNSYCIQYCSKTDETLNIAGVDTVKYEDDGFVYYIDEVSGLCFRLDMGVGTDFVVNTYITECDAFPFQAPTH